MDKSEPLKYLSLKTASESYGYTRDHLGLMIRRGKLKGQKLGNYYVTTKEWMIEYVNNFADPNHPKLKNKMSNKFLIEAMESGKKTALILSSKNNGQITKISKQLAKTPAPNELIKDLQKELIDLMPVPQDVNRKTLKNNEIFTKNYHFTPTESPYIILPIRKMEEIEKNRVLNRLNGADSNTESV
ncbi:MAG: hypothetical protein UV62_C0002G0052 [Parcubacteria group bacterium GW2011_GWC1_43_11]|nr:MAG: hypothetical protein UV62_C0002G0052 [Parcubacteria group bacterium GW2011_GWC1_43_11]